MSDEIIKVLDDLSQRFGIAVDWTSANMLPYLQMLTRKYVNYRLAMSVMELIVGILLFAAAAKLIKAAKVQYRKVAKGEVDYSSEDFCVFTGIACCVGAAFAIFIGFILVVSASGDIITCITFPEKLILDELLQVLKNL